MTLRAGHYRAIQLFYDDGSPVLGPGGREVWVTRCGAELLGTRTDGGDATKNIATFLGIRRKTVAPSGPLTPVTSPGDVGTPGSGFEPGQGQIQGDGEGGLLTVGGGKLIVPEDKEVWVVKPCTRTPGPPLGPFPLGNHVATPLGVQYDGKPVYADGCVECEIPQRYRCRLGSCIQDPQGPYASLAECQANCVPPPQPFCGCLPWGFVAPIGYIVDLGAYVCGTLCGDINSGKHCLERAEVYLPNRCVYIKDFSFGGLTLNIEGSIASVRHSLDGFVLWETTTFDCQTARGTLTLTQNARICPPPGIVPQTITVEGY